MSIASGAMTSPSLARVMSAEALAMMEQAMEEQEPRLTIMKFGGSSIQDAESIRRVTRIVLDGMRGNPVVVLSAMGKTTNMLLTAADSALKGVVDIAPIVDFTRGIAEGLGIEVPQTVEELFQQLSKVLTGISLLEDVTPRIQDFIVSFGERISVRVLSEFFKTQGIAAKATDAWELGMVTSRGAGSSGSAHSDAMVLAESYQHIKASLRPLARSYDHTPVVTGYIAKDVDGKITTLGRDGSDLSASIIGASVRAVEVQIWKDVCGVLTCDPRVVPTAVPVELLTFEEAAELTYFGSKVVHPHALLPIQRVGVPMVVKSSIDPSAPGTRIAPTRPQIERPTAGAGKKFIGVVTAISMKREITMLDISSTRMLGQHGFLAKTFSLFDKFGVSVDVIATSEVSVSLTLDPHFKTVDIGSLTKALERIANVVVSEDLGLITLIVAKAHSTPVMRLVMDTLDDMGIDVKLLSHGASKVNISFLVDNAVVDDVILRLHNILFPAE